jgi:glutaconate CoA-transferase subunit A
MFQWGLKAAAFGLPFLPTRVGLGTDLAELGGLKTVQSPYADGETLIAMPALKLDVALLHVNRSDWRGNVQLFGADVYYDEWFAKAASKTFISCEELVDRMEDHYPEHAQANIFERCFVTGVVEIAGGAHPSSMPPLYGPDMKAFKAYADAAREPGNWAEVFDRFVGANEADYLAGIGGKEAVMQTPLAIY